jgi:hypothetical protein
MRYVIAALSLLAGFHSALAIAAGAALEPYACPFVGEAPVVDGDVSDNVWGRAAALPVRHVLDGDTSPGVPSGTARLLWDETYLYVAFEFEDRDIWSFSDEDDDMLWLGDVAEVFLKPAEDNTLYFEFNVAPSGALMDARFSNRGAGGYYRGKTWASGARVATRVRGTDGDDADEDGGWSVEMAIPFDRMGGVPGAGTSEVWRFGAFRYDYGKQYDRPLQLMSIPQSRAGFHAYEDYRPLVFERPR